MMNRTRGIGLLELMTGLAVAGILLSLALPGFAALLRHQHKAQDTNQLLSLLHFARTEAVLSRRTIGICSGRATCSGSTRWQEGLLVFVDTDLNGRLDSHEELLRHEPLPTDTRWLWQSFQKRSYILFEADGTTRALNGTFTLCRGTTAFNEVVVNLIGRVRTQSPSASSACS